MGFTIKEKAEYVGTFRAIRVFMMETLARWTPTSPELEVKVMLGRHIWDCAQHADALGKRALELRAPLHYSLPPLDTFQHVLDAVNAAASSADRLAAFHGFLLPALAARHQVYLDNVDHLQDEPTVRILQRMAADDARMAAEYRKLVAEIPALAAGRADQETKLRSLDRAATGFVALSEGRALAREAVS